MMTQTSESDRQIKRGQLIFLPVASERIYKIKWFLAGINYKATSDKMPILS